MGERFELREGATQIAEARVMEAGGSSSASLRDRDEGAVLMSPDHSMRQLEDAEIRRPLVPIGEASSRLRQRLESAGVVFRSDNDPGLPGPNHTGVVELSTGTQFAFEHHHAHPEDFVLMRSERGSGRPADRIDELVRVAGVDRADIRRTEDDWDGL